MLPTGIDVSIWHSMWALEKKGAWKRLEGGGGDRTALARRALLDMRVGYGLSVVLGIVFYLLGTYITRGESSPDGAQVAYVADVGDEIAVTVLAPQGGTAYVDVIKERQTVLTRSVEAEETTDYAEVARNLAQWRAEGVLAFDAEPAWSETSPAPGVGLLAVNVAESVGVVPPPPPPPPPPHAVDTAKATNTTRRIR